MGSQYEPGAGPAHSPGTTQDVARDAAQKAGAMWDDAKETARSKLNEQKDTAAEGIGTVAGALRDAARRREGDGDALARLTTSAAEGLDRFSSTLRSKDVSTMLRDIETFARNQPVAFFGMALAAGFLAARVMKADGEHTVRGDGEHWTTGASERSTGATGY